LSDDLRYFFTGDADVERAGDVPLDHLRAMAQNHQRSDGTKAASLQVNGRPVVDLTVDNRVHQAHYLRRQFGHRRRRDRAIVWAVVTLPEIQGSLVQVFGYPLRIFV